MALSLSILRLRITIYTASSREKRAATIEIVSPIATLVLWLTSLRQRACCTAVSIFNSPEPKYFESIMRYVSVDEVGEHTRYTRLCCGGYMYVIIGSLILIPGNVESVISVNR